MDNRPVGVFDSGLGGLTAVRALNKLLPSENIIFFGDNGRAPYGSRTPAEISSMTGEDLAFLLSKGIKAALAACGTISANAGAVLSASPVPCFNVLDASCRAMAAVPGDRPLAMIATAASVKSGAFTAGISSFAPGRRVIAQASQDLVMLIETGHVSIEDNMLYEALDRYLADIRHEKPAALLLGCTHFGIIAEAIDTYLEGSVPLIEASAEGARELAAYLQDEALQSAEAGLSIFTSGDRTQFDAMSRLILSGDAPSCVFASVGEVK